MKETREETYKKIAVDFFRYWWNTSGANTDEGFDKWWSFHKYEYLQPVTDKEATTEQEKPQTAESDLLDLQQYVTNLLYYAHVEAMDMHSIDFDKWVEREVDNLKSYFATQKHIPTDDDIREALVNCHEAGFEIDESYWEGFTSGAKWMKEQIK